MHREKYKFSLGGGTVIHMAGLECCEVNVAVSVFCLLGAVIHGIEDSLLQGPLTSGTHYITTT